MSKVPISHLIKLNITHVGSVYFGYPLTVYLDLPLKVISWLPSNVIEFHLGCDFVHFVDELHLPLGLQLHGSPEASTIFFASKVVDHCLVLEFNGSLSLYSYSINYPYSSMSNCLTLRLPHNCNSHKTYNYFRVQLQESNWLEDDE